MLTSDEIEAAVLGAQWVARNGDAALAVAAQDLIAKIGVAVSERLRSYVLDPVTAMPPHRKAMLDGIDLASLRAQIRAGRKIRLDYRDEQDRPSERIVWPVALGYMELARYLIAWCELRDDFRHFRTDRIAGATLMDDRYPVRPTVLRAQWLRSLAERGKRPAGPLPSP
ncbi:MAG: WYL domain-containing protein [Caulobacteraceae bacterium]